MQVYSLTELLHLARRETFALHSRIVTELPTLTEHNRTIALDNLRRIRRVLSHPTHVPR